MAAISINETMVDRAMGEYVTKADVLRAMTAFTPMSPVTLGSVVVVPYITGSSATFGRATGYSLGGGNGVAGSVGANGVSVTLNANPISSVVINDPTWNVVTEDYAVKAIANARDNVLKAVASGALAQFTIANFSTSTTYSASVALPDGFNTPAAIGDLVYKTVDFPGQKYMLAGSDLLTALNAPYVSGSTVVTTTTAQLLANYPDFTLIPTSLTFQSGIKGGILGEGAVVVVTGLKTPPANQNTTKFIPITIPGMPGVVLAFREFYDDNTGELVSVIEAVAGYAKVNASAGIFVP
jgi:hypothetical protein